ncbi:MAG TPA: hypothetical protein VGO68_07380 [Pyrinomonadaceae bacterium]|nr:hypothetical protein [Pyrinomonadaceae bacterium]
MRRFVLALAMTCALSGTVLAGNIPTMGIAGHIPTDGSTGNIPTMGIASPAPTEPQITSIAATVILTILSLVR